MIFSSVHSCRRGVVHFPVHKTTLLTLTLRHSNTINKQHERWRHERQKNESQKKFTLPLSPIQLNSCNLTKPQAVNTRHQMVTTHNIKNSNMTMLHLTPTPVCNPVFHWNQHPCWGLLWSSNCLQLSASKQVFLLILASILIWVWRKFLILTFATSSVNALNYRYFADASFTTKSIMEPTTRNQRPFVALCSSTVTLLLTKHGGITQEKWLLLPTQIIAIIVSKQWKSSLQVSHSNMKRINSLTSWLTLCDLNLSTIRRMPQTNRNPTICDSKCVFV
jgi:hypothetical protein